MLNFSVVVAVRNDKKIEKCIDSLLKLDYPKSKYEIIIVDNNSNIEVSSIIKKFPVKYFFEKKTGREYARNTGIKNARGKIIAITDADCIVDKNWLTNTYSQFENIKIAGIGGTIRKKTPTNSFQRTIPTVAHGQSELQFLRFYDLPYIVTANAFFRKSVLEKIGSFDTEFPSGADVDISWRIQEQGFEIKLFDKAVIYHADRESIPAYFKQYFIRGKGHVLLFKKHRKNINKKFYINTYPLEQILSAFLSIKPTSKNGIIQLSAVITKCFAVILGNIYGSINYRVVFV